MRLLEKFNLKSGKEWRAYAMSGALPSDIPTNPNKIYEDSGWQGMGDWIGTGTVAPQLKKYRPLEEARTFVRSLGLKTSKEWFAYAKSDALPPDIPANPYQTYAGKGWQGMGDWLGTGTVAPHLRKYRAFEDARAFVRSLGLKSEKEWRVYAKSGALPPDIPASPYHTYAGAGWQSWGDWLGTGRTRRFQRSNKPNHEQQSEQVDRDHHVLNASGTA